MQANFRLGHLMHMKMRVFWTRRLAMRLPMTTAWMCTWAPMEREWAMVQALRTVEKVKERGKVEVKIAHGGIKVDWVGHDGGRGGVMEGYIADESNPTEVIGMGKLGKDDEQVWVDRDVVGDAMKEVDDKKASAVKAKVEEVTVGLSNIIRTNGGIESNNEELESMVGKEEETLGEVR